MDGLDGSRLRDCYELSKNVFIIKNFELTQNFHINPGLQIAWVKNGYCKLQFKPI